MQVRVLICSPPPQVSVQSDQFVNGEYPPSTVNSEINKKILINIILRKYCMLWFNCIHGSTFTFLCVFV